MSLSLRVFTEPQQGATYDDLLRVAQEAERLGFDAFFRSDHYLSMGPVDGRPGPTDAWLTLAGLARDTQRIRLGTLVTAATFRLPGPLAIIVAQVDAMSGGRVELGLGTGWFEQEHAAYGVPFPDQRERFERLEEQFAIITGLWATSEGGTFDFDGTHYRLAGAPGLPKPVQRPHPPLIVGGHGKQRTAALAARYADEFNLPFAPVGEFRPLADAVRARCEEQGRDPSTLTWSVAQVLCCGEDEATFRRRAAAIQRDPDELRANGLAGTAPEVLDKLGTFADAGVQRVYLQTLDLADLDHLRLVAEQVMPAVI